MRILSFLYKIIFSRRMHRRATGKRIPSDSFVPSVDHHHCPQPGGGTLRHWAKDRDSSTLSRYKSPQGARKAEEGT